MAESYQECFRNGTLAYHNGGRCPYLEDSEIHAWNQGVRFEYDLQGTLSMILHLPLKEEYFNAIRDGHKVEEYRVMSPYWKARIEGKVFHSIRFTLGYPKSDDLSKQFMRPWRGYVGKVIIHPHFGNKPVAVYAINC